MSFRNPIIGNSRDDSANPLVVISLGSNLPSDRGDPIATVVSAITELGLLFQTTLKVSALWKTVPLDCPPGTPDFVNAVISFPVPETGCPEAVLEQLQRLENNYGRNRRLLQNASRTLDLDLISWGNQVSVSAELTLPHPRAHLRGFVLRPLAEIAPDLILPGQTQAVDELAAQLPDLNETIIN
ncbi:MAG: 2-amino-4-hydroxy-6-hydroxymethyldihydropteridine diphosphokinase [Pseudohongiellaceae bacterium]